MAKPMKMGCAWCGFETESAEEMVLHMMTSTHGMDKDTAEDLKEGGGFQEFLGVVRAIQADPHDPKVPGGELERVDPDDPDLPQDVKEWIEHPFPFRTTVKREDEK